MVYIDNNRVICAQSQDGTIYMNLLEHLFFICSITNICNGLLNVVLHVAF